MRPIKRAIQGDKIAYRYAGRRCRQTLIFHLRRLLWVEVIPEGAKKCVQADARNALTLYRSEFAAPR